MMGAKWQLSSVIVRQQTFPIAMYSNDLKLYDDEIAVKFALTMYQEILCYFSAGGTDIGHVCCTTVKNTKI